MKLNALMTCVGLLLVRSLAYPQAPSQLAKFSPLTSNPNGSFGNSVAIGDGIWVVGDPGDDEFGSGLFSEAGAVSVFYGPVQSVGQQPVKIFPAEFEFFSFGLAVSAFENRIAVNSDGARTYIFCFTNGRWVQEAVLPHYSTSVALGERQLAIGKGASSVGSVVIYRLDPGLDSADISDDQWIEDSSIMSSVSGDAFGSRVLLDHNRLLVGAPVGLLNGTETGLAFVFERTADGSAWVETARLEPIGATEDANFGRSLSMKNDMILVGAPRDHPTNMGSGKGAAYVFHRDALSGSWTSQGRLLARDGSDDDSFGISVAIGEETIFVGAYFAEVDGKNRAGAVYQFARGSNHDLMAEWHLINKIFASDAQQTGTFGTSMAFGGGTLLIGAHGTDIGGAAYLFRAN